jgi:hypothetical protein
MNTSVNYWKLGGFAACCIYFFYVVLHLSSWHFIDGVNLVIHEAGHVFFHPFGTLLAFMGGSLLQIIIPSLFAGYFWFQREYLSASIILLWVGQNIINVSVYVGDAIVMQLPLLGDDVTMHDWNNILQMMHALPSAPTLSHILYAVGLVVMVGGVGVGAMSIRKSV